MSHHLLFLHGFPFNQTMWRGVIASLATMTSARLLTPNLRGFDRRPLDRAVTSMDDFADDIDLLCRQEAIGPGQLIVCGLSMGGSIALALAARFRQQIAGMILCDTRAVADTPAIAASRRELADQLTSGAKTLHDVADSMLPRLVSPSAKAELVQEVRDVITAHDVSGVAAAARGMAARGDSTPLLPSLDFPTLLVCGDDDVISPPNEMQRWGNLLPRATFVSIPHAGHLAPWEQPTAVANAIATFLREACAIPSSCGGSDR